MQILTVFLSILLLIPALFFIALHFGFRAPRTRETKNPDDFGISFSEESIPTVSGKRLFGWFLPVDKATETIIVLHGWGGNAEMMLPVALPFYQAGANVLLIDSRSHGNSDSDTFSSLPRFAEDLDSAINWLKQVYPNQAEKIAVLGHSVGAGAVLFSASKRDDIQAVISISAFAHPDWMMRRYLQSAHIPQFIIHLVLRYVQWLIGHTFDSIAPLNTVCCIKSPILLVHGKADTIVPLEDAKAIFASCPKPHISLFEVDEAGHESVDKFEEHSDELIKFLQRSGFVFVNG